MNNLDSERAGMTSAMTSAAEELAVRRARVGCRAVLDVGRVAHVAQVLAELPAPSSC